jgi:hypothetical protein
VSTIILSSTDGTGSSTAATTVAKQTANAAPETICCQRWGMVSFLVILGLISW